MEILTDILYNGVGYGILGAMIYGYYVAFTHGRK